MQGDESPRDLKFAVKNCGARIEIVTSGWKRMMLADIELLRVRTPPPRPPPPPTLAQDKLLPDLVDISIDASTNSLAVSLDNGECTPAAAATAVAKK